ncbi:MAG: Fe-S cluster assembly protein SufD [Proteobacteria bacterium]|nr:Fe-S cluster assembly protein SufD [Pseudomonadota bacterium]
MNEVNIAKDYYIQAYEQTQSKLPGFSLPWLKSKRDEAMQFFSEKGFPTRHDEDWKYTNVTPLMEQQFILPSKQAHRLSAERLKPYLLSEMNAHILVFVDGYFSPEFSQCNKLPSGVTLKNLSAELLENPKNIQSYLSSALNSKEHAFNALNTALMTEGAWIHIDKHVVVENPIQLLFISTQEDAIHHYRNCIVVEENTSVNLIEQYVGLQEAPYFNNSVTEIIAKPNAQIEHVKIQQEGATSFHVGTLQVHQYQHSSVNTHSFSFGGSLVRSDTNISLKDEYSECTLNGLYVASNHQHIDHHTRVEHIKPHGTSREYYKGILNDSAKAVFNGKVLVNPGAEKTQAEQSNKNLLLSRQAEINTKPQLEIFADDVKCAHGATVGQLDEKSLFYLRSRGIEKEAAKQLLVHAFASEIINRVKWIPLRERLELYLAY